MALIERIGQLLINAAKGAIAHDDQVSPAVSSVWSLSRKLCYQFIYIVDNLCGHHTLFSDFM